MEQFEKVKSLGRGAQGTVILVRRKADKNKFCIKKIYIDDQSPEDQQEVMNEIRVRRLRHVPCCVLCPMHRTRPQQASTSSKPSPSLYGAWRGTHVIPVRVPPTCRGVGKESLPNPNPGALRRVHAGSKLPQGGGEVVRWPSQGS